MSESFRQVTTCTVDTTTSRHCCCCVVVCIWKQPCTAVYCIMDGMTDCSSQLNDKKACVDVTNCLQAEQACLLPVAVLTEKPPVPRDVKYRAFVSCCALASNSGQTMSWLPVGLLVASLFMAAGTAKDEVALLPEPGSMQLPGGALQ